MRVCSLRSELNLEIIFDKLPVCYAGLVIGTCWVLRNVEGKIRRERI
jgi:hypothetical protein